MEEFGAILWIWFVHAVIAAVLSAPIVFLGRKRVHWYAWELLALVLPFSVWTLHFFSELSKGRKSLSNLAEPLFFSFAVPVAALVRVIIGRRINEQECGIYLIIALGIAAAGVFLIVPPLPE